jgi:hypothetical protein
LVGNVDTSHILIVVINELWNWKPLSGVLAKDFSYRSGICTCDLWASAMSLNTLPNIMVRCHEEHGIVVLPDETASVVDNCTT